MPSISLCVIAKNEEANIQRCLKSALGFANELIVIDTGSTDATKEIAMELGAQVYDFKWQDNFADARNFSLEKATGDWILWLDADEELRVKDTNPIHALLERGSDDLLPMGMTHFYGAAPAEIVRSHRSTSFRLFRNHIGICFIGSIHEHLDVATIRQYPKANQTDGIEILHYGYMDEQLSRNGKKTRNLTMLTHELHGNPENPWLSYHLASEYYRLGDYNQAFEQVNAAMIKFIKQDILPPSLAYKLKYDVLMAAGSFHGAWPGIEKAIALYPDYVDLHFCKGMILLARDDLAQAASVFQHCLQLGEENPSHLIMTGTGSFYPAFYLGICFEALGKQAEAEAAYQLAISLNPSLKKAREELWQ